jgi:hypothetical protein
MECPGCGIDNDATTHIQGEDVQPQEGDLSVCFSCGVITQFNKDMISEPVTTEFLQELKESDFDVYQQVTEASYRVKELN